MADSNDPETQNALASFRKAMVARGTILDNERIDSFFLNDSTIQAEINTYGDDQEGYVSYGADRAVDRLKKSYPELFTDQVRMGGTPPRSHVEPPLKVEDIVSTLPSVESIKAGARRVLAERQQQARGMSPQAILRLKQGPKNGKM